MNKTKIDWCDFTWNPVVGCRRGCPYCYARKLRKRFNSALPYEKIISYDERLIQPLKQKTPSRIFVGSMSDIEYWTKEQMNKVLRIAEQCQWHQFLFLTKNGEVYYNYEFPLNCWLGVTTVSGRYFFKIRRSNRKNIKFLSIEPLLGKITGYWLNAFIDWVILGGLTPKPVHKKEWIDCILKECRRLKTPVFIKHNVHYPEKIQEYPATRPANQDEEKP